MSSAWSSHHGTKLELKPAHGAQVELVNSSSVGLCWNVIEMYSIGLLMVSFDWFSSFPPFTELIHILRLCVPYGDAHEPSNSKSNASMCSRVRPLNVES